MKASTERIILRWTHIVFGVPVVGYEYTPFKAIPEFAWIVRFIFMPLLLLSGLWMWKVHVVRRLFQKQLA